VGKCNDVGAEVFEAHRLVVARLEVLAVFRGLEIAEQSPVVVDIHELAGMGFEVEVGTIQSERFEKGLNNARGEVVDGFESFGLLSEVHHGKRRIHFFREKSRPFDKKNKKNYQIGAK
jgi:hypothetical protein